MKRISMLLLAVLGLGVALASGGCASQQRTAGLHAGTPRRYSVSAETYGEAPPFGPRGNVAGN